MVYWLLLSHSVMSDSLPPHGLQHTRLPYRPLSPRVCSSSCPLSQRRYLTISSSTAIFSFCLQSFLAMVYSVPNDQAPLMSESPFSGLPLAHYSSATALVVPRIFQARVLEWDAIAFSETIAYFNIKKSPTNQVDLCFTR